MSITATGPDDATLRALNYEREANRRIAVANDTAKAAEKDAEVRIQHIEDAYDREAVAQNSRNELALQNQLLKGYEHVRDLQRSQQGDSRRLVREGETEVSHLNEHYKNTKFKLEEKSKQELEDIQRQNNHRVEYERKMNSAEVDDVRGKYTADSKQAHELAESRLNKLIVDDRKLYEKTKAQTEQAQERVKTNFDEKLKKVVTESADMIQEIEGKTTEKAKQIQEQTSHQLAAYAHRQRDPFYKMINLRGHLREYSDGFVLTARVPVYEQKHISASVRGDNLMISGYRRNEEQVEVEPGHTLETNSFQAFHENFPLSYPVDANQLTKEFEGETVIIRVPKKNEYAFRKPEIRKPGRVRIEHPRLPVELSPENLQEKDTNPPEEGKYKKEPGTGTLT